MPLPATFQSAFGEPVQDVVELALTNSSTRDYPWTPLVDAYGAEPVLNTSGL